jgi:hypothetical protein
MKDQLKCKWCDKVFRKESTLVAHMCEPKRRILSESDRPNRIGYHAWLTFRKLMTPNAKKTPTYEDFSKNKYYTTFVKLGRRIVDINIPEPDNFIKYLIMNSVKFSNWGKDWVYEMYIRELTKKETVQRAAERTVLLMQQWGMDQDQDWKLFWDDVSTTQALHWIRTGRLSPWVLLGTEQGKSLLGRFDEKQLQDATGYIEIDPWRIRIARNKEDCKWMQQVFDQVGKINA